MFKVSPKHIKIILPENSLSKHSTGILADLYNKFMGLTSSITFRVDQANRLSTTTAIGIITDELLFEAFERLVTASDYDSTFNELVDLRKVDEMAITSEAIRQIERLFAGAKYRSSNKVAIVAPAGEVFRKARLYQQNSWKSELIKVCRDLKTAAEWLDIPFWSI